MSYQTLAYCCYDNDLVPVTNMFDLLGDETKNIEDAADVVLRLGDDKWIAIQDIDPASLHKPN